MKRHYSVIAETPTDALCPSLRHLLERTNGELLYEGCAVCHMPEGWGLSNGAYPQIAGQHHAVTIKQLTDIRNKNRDNPSMYPYTIPE